VCRWIVCLLCQCLFGCLRVVCVFARVRACAQLQLPVLLLVVAVVIDVRVRQEAVAVTPPAVCAQTPTRTACW
jgi:hypothetical protein